ncbi:DUF2158 domain-containing protein [Pseudomonas sp. Sample_11]|uniref:DUF2158 domain-containing protein n=1 Tax=Pseudomonas sp. Sample_11 TaxID=2448261 RepID=UPI001032B84D|nr:DUF2158 domain-containing protein [Pseudomonas sp. Sample_11]
MPKFKVGDVVTLSSGGQKMSVSSVAPIDFGITPLGRNPNGKVRHDLVMCRWKDKKGVDQKHRYQEDELILVPKIESETPSA